MAWKLPLSTSAAGHALDLAANDSAFISDGVVLTSSGTFALQGAGGLDQKIVVHGTVAGAGGIGLSNTAGGTISIGETGRATGTTGSGLSAEGGGVSIENAGVIETLSPGGPAIAFYPTQAGAVYILDNTGTVEGFKGIFVSGTGDGAVVVKNSGSIIATDYAYSDASGNTDNILNLGVISGGVGLGYGDDLFDSRAGSYSGGVLDGGAGNDRLWTGSGIQYLNGQAGNDTLMGGAGADKLDGGAEVDTASYASAAAGVKANLANAAQNTGDAKGDTFASIERLVGSKFADALIGNAEANQITGGAGADTLTGGAGADRFVFATAPGGTSSADRITDFATDLDEFRLDDASFAGLAVGNLSGGAFWASTSGAAHDGTDRVIYETDTGWLRFDADGAGAGAAVAFAKLGAGLSLGADDVFVF